MHQCATVQLDFQMPIRFNLDYMSHQRTRERPVMVHRAMLGSVERFIAILTEHFRGRWPFWLSPRQVMVVPMLAGNEEENKAANEYAKEIAQVLKEFYVELPNSGNDHHNEAIKKAFDMGTKFCLCIGPAEVKSRTVSVEGRQPYGSNAKGPVHYGICSLDSLHVWLRALQRDMVLDANVLTMPETPAFQKQSYKKKQLDEAAGGDAPSKAPAASGQPAPKRKQEEVVARKVEPPKASGHYYVGEDVFPTNVPALIGKRFTSVAEYVSFLNSPK